MLKHLRLAAFLILIITGAALAAPTLPQVYHEVAVGDITGADRDMHEVLKAHPDSARAHFVYAVILQKEGDNSKATSELREAQRLSPGLTFVAPEAVTRLQQQLGIVTSTPPKKSHTFFWVVIVLLGATVLTVVLVLWVNDSNRRWRETYEPEKRKRDQDDDNEPRDPRATRESYPYPHQADPNYRLRSGSTYVPQPPRYQPPVQSGPTIVNNNTGSGNDGMLTGVLLGEAMSSRRDDRDTNINNSTTIIEREPERQEERSSEERREPEREEPVQAAPEPAPDLAPEIDPAPTDGGWGSDSSNNDTSDNFGVSSSSDSDDSGNSGGGGNNDGW